MKYVTITSDWDDGDRHKISKEELQKNFNNIAKRFKQEFGVTFALNQSNKTYHLEIDDDIPLKQVEQLMKSLKMDIRGREESAGKDRAIRGYCPQGELKNHIVIFMDYNKKTKSGPYIFDMEGYLTDPYLN